MARPRITRDVREGWAEVRAFVTCELESGQAEQFECREHYRLLAESGDPDAPAPDPDTCPCEGCTAARNAWKAIRWVDARLVLALTREGGA